MFKVTLRPPKPKTPPSKLQITPVGPGGVRSTAGLPKHIAATRPASASRLFSKTRDGDNYIILAVINAVNVFFTYIFVLYYCTKSNKLANIQQNNLFKVNVYLSHALMENSHYNARHSIT